MKSHFLSIVGDFNLMLFTIVPVERGDVLFSLKTSILSQKILVYLRE